ncbi:MAG: 3-oxoadipate enol-lactonase [Silicimonas sp.]|nr:3-oxoadipate enol-lactonase [Silicimonas sp.]
MTILQLSDVDLHYRLDGNPDGPAVVFANSLGTDLRLWDPVMRFLPDSLLCVRYDKRGHGLSACPPPPYSMGSLVRDAEMLLDHLNLRDTVFVGCSIGGMIAQGLAVKRLDQVRAMVLCNTGAKIGTVEMWQDRIATVKEGGIEAIADAVMDRWFSKEFRSTAELIAWRNMLTRQPDAGYVGCSAAISGTDFFETTASLTLPTLAIAGSEDGATPPDLVRETAALVKGSRFHLIRGAGHLPMVEKPEIFSDHLSTFLKEIGHE